MAMRIRIGQQLTLQYYQVSIQFRQPHAPLQMRLAQYPENNCMNFDLNLKH